MHLGNAPFLAWHLDGDTAWIDLLFVPRDQRRKGRGRQMISDLIAHLPAFVRSVEVLPAQIDDEIPSGFWQKMGFEPDDVIEEIIVGCFMHRDLHPSRSLAAVYDDNGRGVVVARREAPSYSALAAYAPVGAHDAAAASAAVAI